MSRNVLRVNVDRGKCGIDNVPKCFENTCVDRKGSEKRQSVHQGIKLICFELES